MATDQVILTIRVECKICKIKILFKGESYDWVKEELSRFIQENVTVEENHILVTITDKKSVSNERLNQCIQDCIKTIEYCDYVWQNVIGEYGVGRDKEKLRLMQTCGPNRNGVPSVQVYKSNFLKELLAK